MLLSYRHFPLLPLRRRFLLIPWCFGSSALHDLDAYKSDFARRMDLAGLKPHHRIAIGVSGGPDSMALCLLAASWKSRGHARNNESSGFVDGLLGIVVDHGLRPESSGEAELVKSRVNRIGVRCEILRIEWPDGQPEMGKIQEAAREMRYKCLFDNCRKQQMGVLLIAHHADDQAELFILRLSRNSGVIGLAGMAFVSQLFPMNVDEGVTDPSIMLVRPLLDFSKDDIYKICRGGNQEWVEDPTNRSMLFCRNRIRKSLKTISSSSRSELQNLLKACRLTRKYVDASCLDMIRCTVTVVEHGYAIIDLAKLKPMEVDDICLSRYLTHILQFISQRHRPLRGKAAQLTMDYVRRIPSKTSLTVAGCYLCPAPQSKGSKILVCCSADSQQTPSIGLSSKPSYQKQLVLHADISEIISNARVHCNQSDLASPTVPFMTAKSATEVLTEGKKLGIISCSTFETISLLQQCERDKFIGLKEIKQDRYIRREKMSLPLSACQSCHFMSRFVVVWEFTQVTDASVRCMLESDWLLLSEISRASALQLRNYPKEIIDPGFMQLSATNALEALRHIPASARLSLPVIVNSHGFLLSIPSIGFICHPNMSAKAVFKPRVPLGGGYSLYI